MLQNSLNTYRSTQHLGELYLLDCDALMADSGVNDSQAYMPLYLHSLTEVVRYMHLQAEC